jgi:hypothetical protein
LPIVGKKLERNFRGHMFFLFASTAFAGSFVLVSSENRIDFSGGVVPRAKGIIDIGVADHFSLTTTFVLSPGYGEAYIGPTWSPTAHFSLGIAGGLETADDPWRVMAYSMAGYRSLHLLGVVEYGGSGLWYKGVVSYAIGPVSIGAMAQRFDGLGPRIAVSRWNLELWAAPLYDFEAKSPSALVGLNWTPTM